MDAAQSRHILFICTANTCRSPMAAALFRHALAAEPEPLKSLLVESAGISAIDGYGPAANSVEAVRKVGLRLADHKSTELTEELIRRALAIFCMTDSHRAMIEARFDPPPKRIYLMRDFLPDAEQRDIPDPFGSNLAAYEAARDAMVEAIPSLLAYVRDLVSKEPA